MIRNSKAFTIIELLVSITIIFILLGIVLYAANGVRDSSRTTVCATSIMQLSKALSLYVSDYDSTYPVAFDGTFKDSENGGWQGTGNLWYSFVFPYVNGHDANKVISCPSLGSVNVPYDPPQTILSGYAYNIYLSERIYDHLKLYGKTESEIDYSSLVVTFADARIGIIATKEPDINSNRHQGAISYHILKDIIKSQPSGATRHHGGANYTFVDGHVKWFKPGQLSINKICDGKTPGFGL